MKEIRVKISKDGTLTLQKDIKDEFKGSSAKLFRSKSDRFTIVKTVSKVVKTDLPDRETISGREISREDIENILRKVRPGLLESAKAESENLTFDEVVSRMREIGKEITPKELEEEIRAVRNEELRRRKLL